MSAGTGAAIDADFVRRAADLAGLEITPQQMPGVLANLQRTAEAALALAEFPLGPLDEAGPVFRA